MAYRAATVANQFLRLAQRDGKNLTNMKLQKLVYIAHGYHLALTGRPLLSDEIKAWQWGPVIPDLYEALRQYGARAVTAFLPSAEVDLDPVAISIIEKVWKAYGNLPAFQLSSITHKKGSPWSQTWLTWQYGIIGDDLIESHYRQLLNERRRPNEPQ